MLLADFNCDGQDDLFTGNENEGVTVYRNTSSGGNLSFTLEHPMLSTTNGFQVEVPATDIPAITDVDGDNDLDILAFDYAGSSVVWYQNNQNCGIHNYSFGSLCWGEFAENASNSSITLGVSCRTSLPSQQADPQLGSTRHAGSTLLVFDANGDGFRDALIGDISSSRMVFLQNSAGNVMVSQTQNYPASNPVDLFIFPGSFLQDVDNDGLPDLLVAPNNGADPGGKNFDQVLYYRNTGTASSPNFVYQKNDFLEGQMLDFGSAAAPAFFDYDADGDLDLVVGNYAYRQNSLQVSAQLALLRNNGSNAQPSYELIDTDYLGLSALSGQFLTDLAPTFGDLDGDGDLDLLLGRNDGFLMFYRNTAAAGQPAAFTLEAANYQNINVGLLSKPHIVDLNRDNLPDLVIGNRSGRIFYYRNTGTASSPAFTLETATLGNIDLRPNANSDAGMAAPFVADLDGNGNYDLIAGDRIGKVHIYPNIEGNLGGTFAEQANTFLEPQFFTDTLRYSQRTAPTAADLTGDGKPDLIVGTFRGGLRVFENVTGLVAAPELSGIAGLELFPNPVQGQLFYTVPAAAAAGLQVRLFNPLGQELQLPVQASTQSTGMLDLSHLPSGLYALRFTTAGGKVEVRRVVRQ